jgi:hypothetical protein
MWNRFIRSTTILPRFFVVGIAVWGGFYLIDCAQTLLAPGTGFSIKYKTSGGDLTISAKSYSYDSDQSVITLSELMIKEPDGKLIARVPKLLITGVKLDRGLAPIATIRDAEAWIRRDSKGRLSLQNYLPEKKEGGEETPYELTLERCKINFLDSSVPGTATNLIQISKGNISGRGSRLVGDIDAKIDQIFTARLSFHQREDDFFIRGSNVKTDLKAVLLRLASGYEAKYLNEIKPLRLSKAEVSGRFEVGIPAGGKVSYRADLVASLGKTSWDRYRIDAGQITGTFDQLGFRANVKSSFGKVKANIEGEATYGKNFNFRGNTTLTGIDEDALRSYDLKLPQDVKFTNVDVDGTLVYKDKNFSFSGDAIGRGIQAFGIPTATLQSNFSLRDDLIIASFPLTKIGKSQISGFGEYGLKTKRWQGEFDIPLIDSNDFPKWVPSDLRGSTGQFRGSFRGIGKKPEVQLIGRLNPSFIISKKKYSFQNAEIALLYKNNQVEIQRAVLEESRGSLYAKGFIDFNKGYNLDLTAGRLELTDFFPKLRGRVDTRGKIKGTFNNPTFVGNLEGYELGYEGLSGDVSALATSVSASKNAVEFGDILAVKGAGQLSGNVKINPETLALGGTVSLIGLNISDLYDGPIAGVLDLNNITLGGNFNKPAVSGSFFGRSIIAANVRLNESVGTVKFESNVLSVSGGSADVAGGQFQDIEASYNVPKNTGSVTGRFNKLDLNEIALAAVTTLNQKLPNTVALGGTASGKVNFGIEKGIITSLSASGRVDEIKLNDALLGSGDWLVGLSDSQWKGGAFIGSLEEYFKVDSASYNALNGKLNGELTTYNVPIQEFLRAAEPAMNLSEESRDRLRNVKGNVGLLASVSGTLKKPILSLPEFEVSGIELANKPIGTLSMRGVYVDDQLKINDGQLLGPNLTSFIGPGGVKIDLPDKISIPDSTTKFSGSVKDRQIQFTASLNGFSLDKLSGLFPQLESTQAVINRAALNISGTLDQPQILATSTTTIGMPKIKNERISGLFAKQLVLDSELQTTPIPGLNQSNVSLNSKFSLSSITGDLVANVILGNNGTYDQNSPLSAEIKLNGDRDITPFIGAIPGLVTSDSGARLSGGVKIGRTFNNPLLEGGFKVNVDAMRLVTKQPLIGKPIDTTLQNLNLGLNIERDAQEQHRLVASASTSTTLSPKSASNPNLGTMAMSFGVPIQDVLNQQNKSSSFFERPIIDGNITISDFKVYQGFPQDAFATATAFTRKPISISGTLQNPLISGDMFFKGVSTIIPTLVPQEGDNRPVVFNPAFDLKYSLTEPATIKSSLAQLSVNGGGQMTGKLSTLDANGRLVIEKGSLSLPGAKVKLVPDGTLDFSYKATNVENPVKFVANMRGETNLTALKNGLTPERYDITLDVTGDIIKPNGLRLDATSQPSGLDRDRILQLLGRADLLQSFLQPNGQSDVEGDVRQAITSIALPSFFGGVTNNLARNFGFEYASVDYNAFEQASISFAKSLGNGFFFQGRRQLSAPLPGQLAAFDYRLAYRPRSGPDSIRNLSFSLGADQLRPYKLSIDFTTRVRTQNPTERKYKWIVPNK